MAKKQNPEIPEINGKLSKQKKKHQVLINDYRYRKTV